MNPIKHENDKIYEIMSDSKLVRDSIQSGINAALLMHKRAGNPVCESRNNQVVWIEPENISVDK